MEEDVDGDGVRSDPDEGPGPGAVLLDVDDPVKETEQDRADAGGEKDEGGGPDFFDNGKLGVPEKSDGDTDDSPEEKEADFARRRGQTGFGKGGGEEGPPGWGGGGGGA